MTTVKPITTVHVYTDVVHPASGEVLAEWGDVLDAATPRAKHVLAVVAAYADHYHLVHSDDAVAVAVHEGKVEIKS